MTPAELLQASRTILLIDWPDREVPESLARAGFEVVASEGPAPEDYRAYEVEGDAVVTRPAGGQPAQADIVYSHRPTDELPDIVNLAREVGARAVWCETGSDQARRIVESAGLDYVDHPPIANAVREMRPRS